MTCEDATVRLALRMARSVEARIFLPCVNLPLAFTRLRARLVFPAVLLVQHAGQVYVHVGLADAQARARHDFNVTLRQIDCRRLDAQPTPPAFSAEVLDESLHFLTPKAPSALSRQSLT
jgi:hypothetical protein